MLSTLRERVTELESMQQRADRLRMKTGTTQISRETFLRTNVMAGREVTLEQDTIEIDVEEFAELLQSAVTRSCEMMLGSD